MATVLLPLSGEGVRIGRDSEVCGVHSSDPMLSAVHALVRRDGDTWIVEDCNSANHTYLNESEQPTARAPLSDRDVIRCASLWVQCRLPQLPVSTTSAQASAATQEIAELQARLAVAAQEMDGLQQRLKATSAEREQAQRDALAISERLAAAQRTEAIMPRELQRQAEELKVAREQLSRMKEDSLASSMEQSALRADCKHLQEQVRILTNQEDEVHKGRDLLLVETNNARKEMEALHRVIHEREQSIESLRHAMSEIEQQFRPLHDHSERRDKELEQLRIERGRLRDEQQLPLLALSHAEEELRKLKQDNAQLQRLVASQRASGQELSQQSSELATLKTQNDTAQQQLAALRQSLEVVFDGMRSVILALAGHALAVQKGLARLEVCVSDRDAVRSLAQLVDQMIIHTEDAQGQLRGLRRLIG